MCFKDRYHIGQDQAEAQGTYSRKAAHRQQREMEEQEEEDEAEGLVDQAKGGSIPALPGLALPGLALPGMDLPGLAPQAPPLHHAQMPFNPAPPPQFGGLPKNVDLAAFAGMAPERMAQIIGGHGPPPPIPGQGMPFPPPGMPIPPPGFIPHGMPGMPPNFAPPPGFMPPPGFQPPTINGGVPGIPGIPDGNSGGGGGARRRAPLPSQEDSLQAELRQGRFRQAR
jgi:polyadenylation factor subunit 2